MADTAPTLTAEDEEQQSAFVRIFLIVLGALVLFTLFCMVVARLLSGGASGVENDPILKADVANRIAPVGSVRTSADADADGGAVQVAAAQSGEEIVQGVCAACHISGVGGAPLLDDEAAWAERRDTGLDALTASVINGKGAMPPRAGTQLSDDELRRAVAHMAGIEMEEAAAEPATDTGSETTAADSDAAGTDASSSEGDASAEADSEAGNATDSEASPSGEASSDTDASGSTATASTAAAGATAAATVQNDGSAATIVAAELTDRIKSTSDGVCAACHLSGVGGAPKIGDKDAWAARAEKGLGGMVAVVAAGKGAMPARGGSDLNDQELAAAINYLMSK